MVQLNKSEKSFFFHDLVNLFNLLKATNRLIHLQFHEDLRLLYTDQTLKT